MGRDAGIVHRNVQPAPGRHDRVYEMVDRFLAAYVGGQHQGPPSQAPDRCGSLLKRFSATPDQGHVGARFGESGGDRPAYTGATAGDQRGLAGQ